MTSARVVQSVSIAAAGASTSGGGTGSPYLVALNFAGAQRDVVTTGAEYARTKADLKQRLANLKTAAAAVGKADGELEVARMEQASLVAKVKELYLVMSASWQNSAVTDATNREIEATKVEASKSAQGIFEKEAALEVRATYKTRCKDCHSSVICTPARSLAAGTSPL